MSLATCQRIDARGRPCGGEIEDGVCGTCGRPEQKGALIAAAGTGSLARGTSNTVTHARGSTGAIGTGAIGMGTTGFGRSGSGRISRRHTNASSTSRRQSLGGGLVSLPPVPSQDPEKLVMENPEVAPAKRSCPHCQAKVGRMKGFCGQCGKPYDFEPKLKRGDVVAGKYEIRGPIGLGGMGWIYLATDLVLKRWVVLKGVLNAQDPEAAAAAVAERQFLAAVKDPRIVQIYDFCTQGADGYMVLEYVGGRTVDQIRADLDVVDLLDETGKVIHRGVLRKDIAPQDAKRVAQVTKFGVLPPEQAIAYMLAICPAFAALHAQGFTHNDMKPDNVMVEGDSVKLLDLGAMRRIGDEGGLIFGTEGFFAPEAAEDPVAVSDLYSIGRSLAILLMDFLYKVRADTDQVTGRVTTRRLIVTSFKAAIPNRDEQPVMKRYDSLYRFLLRATHEDPDQRFQSAEEMEWQLYGILREVMAEKTGPKPAESKVFFGDNLVDGADAEGASKPLARTLPLLRIDPSDPAATDLVALAAVVDPAKRVEALQGLQAKRPKSVEARLRFCDALISQALLEPALSQALLEPAHADGLLKRAIDTAEAVLRDDEFEWRAHWYAGKALLAAGQATKAHDRFDHTYFEMPGDLGPKLGIAAAAEASGDLVTAERFYAIVAMIDPSYASAGFGLARCRMARRDREAAAAALAAIPPSSSMATEARLVLGHVLTDAADMSEGAGLERAAATLSAIKVESARLHQLSGALLAKAAQLVGGVIPADPNKTLLGSPIVARRLRFAAESEYLKAGRFAATASEKAAWIDRAHAVRPSTLL